ncbi:MAG: hypothetical protein H6819_06155 [Phycisphaerales bacterium]|nr:hypothetical protein [Phycisphaerales bacterium]MCB9858597.1 hypothetical protein [Phycisphaerales bacterium]
MMNDKRSHLGDTPKIERIQRQFLVFALVCLVLLIYRDSLYPPAAIAGPETADDARTISTQRLEIVDKAGRKRVVLSEDGIQILDSHGNCRISAVLENHPLAHESPTICIHDKNGQGRVRLHQGDDGDASISILRSKRRINGAIIFTSAIELEVTKHNDASIKILGGDLSQTFVVAAKKDSGAMMRFYGGDGNVVIDRDGLINIGVEKGDKPVITMQDAQEHRILTLPDGEAATVGQMRTR